MPVGLSGARGFAVESNARGLLYTYNRDEPAQLNDLGRLFLALASATPTAGAPRVFAHVTNNTDRSLSVMEFFLTCAAVENVDVFLGNKETAALAGNTVTALTSLNGGQSRIPAVTFNVGASITNFDANAKQVDYLAVTVANAADRRTPKGEIVIPPNGVLYARANLAGNAAKLGIVLAYQPRVEETV